MSGAKMSELHNLQQRTRRTGADTAKASHAVRFDNHVIVVGRNVIKARRVLQHKHLSSDLRTKAIVSSLYDFRPECSRA